MKTNFNKRITIQKGTTTSDNAGGTTITWADATTIWAHVHPVNPMRLMELGQDFQGTVYEMTVRFDALNSTTLGGTFNIGRWRIVYNSKNLKIHKFWNPNEDKTISKILAADA